MSDDAKTICDLKRILDECLTDPQCSEPTRVNNHKTSADLLVVRFPTFVARRSRSSSNVPQITIKLEDRLQKKTADPTDIRLSKYSSTSNLFIQHTISRPDTTELMLCVAKALHVHIMRGTDRTHKVYFDAFDEEIYPLMDGWDSVHMPSEYVVTEFVQAIFHYQKMDVECAVMSLIYVERLLEITNMTMDAINWRRVLLASIIVSLKVWAEHAVWTQDFLHLFNDYITVQDLNHLELQFLGLIRYHLAITASTYATYYFELRSLSHTESKLPERPLRKKAARRLERQSSKITKPRDSRSRSMSLSELRCCLVEIATAAIATN